MAIKRLYIFGDSNFLRPGLNCTVRSGVKWLGSDGEDLEIWLCNGEVEERIGFGRVAMTKLENYTPHIQKYLRYQFDPYCTTFRGLDKAMKRAYPNGVEEQVTIVMFEVTHIGAQIFPVPKNKKEAAKRVH